MKKKHMFLYIPAWWGHLSTAKAVVSYFDKYYSSYVETVTIDALEKGNRLLKKVVVDGYKKSQERFQRAFEFLYRCNKFWPIAKLTQVLISRFLEPKIKKMLLEQKPTHITILHFFLVRPTMQALKSLSWNIPVTTIITDPFTVNKLRSLDKNMQYVVFSKQAKDTLLGRGISSANIHTTSIVLNEKFNRPLSEEKVKELKTKFGLKVDKKTILILWWGDGIPQWAQTLQGLIDEKIDAQILVVCGRSTSLFKQTTKIASKHPEMHIKIFGGFIDFVYEILNVSDIVITKGWPATLMEILMMKKIPCINSYIREQEKWNVQFVVENNLGFYEPNVWKMVERVKKLLESERSREKYRHTIQSMFLRNGTEEVVKYLLARK